MRTKEEFETEHKGHKISYSQHGDKALVTCECGAIETVKERGE